MEDLDLEWENFLQVEKKHNNTDYIENDRDENEEVKNNQEFDINKIPKATNIYISTKTIITYINNNIDLLEVFWKIPIINYNDLTEGIIKKQIKINSNSKEELESIQKKIDKNLYYEEHIISHIENPKGRIQYKDTRKISIGLCKKDVLTYRSKKKSAFYNCFVIILRIKDENKFKEIHIKVFNTGKLEIPGIQDNLILNKALNLLVNMLKNITEKKNLSYIKNQEETVLINSNFNCGFYIDREKLYDILKYKYYINSCYDPCSYPGIQCEFYYNKSNPNNNGRKSNDLTNNSIKISFMIFRTGSVLIVGKCTEDILYYIYNFIKNLLHNEFKNIVTKITPNYVNEKIKKPKKKTIFIQSN